jgi:hypothetical protein
MYPTHKTSQNKKKELIMQLCAVTQQNPQGNIMMTEPGASAI